MMCKMTRVKKWRGVRAQESRRERVQEGGTREASGARVAFVFWLFLCWLVPKGVDCCRCPRPGLSPGLRVTGRQRQELFWALDTESVSSEAPTPSSRACPGHTHFLPSPAGIMAPR